jgi:hypothetical protein
VSPHQEFTGQQNAFLRRFRSYAGAHESPRFDRGPGDDHRPLRSGACGVQARQSCRRSAHRTRERTVAAANHPTVGGRRIRAWRVAHISTPHQWGCPMSRPLRHRFVRRHDSFEPRSDRDGCQVFLHLCSDNSDGWRYDCLAAAEVEGNKVEVPGLVTANQSPGPWCRIDNPCLKGETWGTHFCHGIT